MEDGLEKGRKEKKSFLLGHAQCLSLGRVRDRLMVLASLCLDSPSAVLLAQTQIVASPRHLHTTAPSVSPLPCDLPHTPAEILLHALDPGTLAWLGPSVSLVPFS